MTRQDASGNPPGGLSSRKRGLPGSRLSEAGRSEAHTQPSRRRTKESIEAGKLADFVVLVARHYDDLARRDSQDAGTNDGSRWRDRVSGAMMFLALLLSPDRDRRQGACVALDCDHGLRSSRTAQAYSSTSKSEMVPKSRQWCSAAKRPNGSIAAGRFGRCSTSGFENPDQFRVLVPDAGDYVLLLDNRLEGRFPAEVSLKLEIDHIRTTRRCATFRPSSAARHGRSEPVVLRRGGRLLGR